MNIRERIRKLRAESKQELDKDILQGRAVIDAEEATQKKLKELRKK